MRDPEDSKCSTWNPYQLPATAPDEEDAFHQASFNDANMAGHLDHFLVDAMWLLILNAVVHAAAERLGLDLLASGAMGFLRTLITFFLSFAGLGF